ncbi:MAG: hypothetical protein RDU59_02145 [Thermodesulfobacteriota bacterium]|nr:hypothetical protein [Thermodesulfobacteriota bacterium]
MAIDKVLLIEQYLRTERILREFFDRYTVSVCVGYCVENEEERDCCIDQTPRITEIKVNSIASDISILRATKYPLTRGKGCGYLTSTGCFLNEYRSPVCNTFVCQVLVDHLNLISNGLGQQLRQIERLSVAIFKGFPEAANEKIQELEEKTSALSGALNAILPSGVNTWEYVMKLSGQK